jgi:virginiamycin B lyase
VGPDGNLWYTDEVSGVFKFSPKTLGALACSASSPAVGCEVSANAVAPADIVAGPDGALWFTQSAGGNPRDGRSYFQAGIGRITTTGSYTSYTVPASASSVPGLDAITLGPNGNLWFTETAVNRIGEITPKAVDPTIHEFALPAADRLAAGVGSSITSADTIAAGPGNDIWFTEQGSNAIGVMSTSGTLLSKFTVPNSSLNPTPQGITEGPDQTMWFTENATNEVASITAQGKITAYALPGAASGPASIVYGPDGSLWFTDNTGVGSIDPSTGKVTLYRAHTASSGPVGITVGPDCTSIWFTESSADRLGRIAPVPNTTGCKPGAPIAVPEAPLSFSPSPLALGDVVVGSSGGVTETLKVTNLTSQAITLGALGYERTADGTGAGTIRFTVDASKSTCAVGVVLGRVGESAKVTRSCDFVVTFTVSNIGAFGATLSLASTGQNRTALPAATLPFSGTGVASP